MPVLAEHQTTVQIDGMPEPLPVSRERLGMDLEWVPFTQATLTVPLGDGAIAALDPTASVIWATVTVRRVLGRTDRIADLTRRYRHRTIADISAQFDAAKLSAVTATTYHDYAAPGTPRRKQERTFRMVLRSVDIDRASATVELVLGGAEILLLDDCNHGGDFTVPGATSGAVVSWVLARTGLPRESFGLESVPADSVPYNANAVWRAGQSAWDFLQQQLRAVWGYLIYADSTGVIRFRLDRGTGQTRTLRSTAADRAVVNEVAKRARDDGWYEAVHVEFDNALGVASTGRRGPVLRIRKNTLAPEPIPTEPNRYAATVLATVRGRGTALELLAVSDYDLTPGDTGRYLNPRANLQGRVVAVEWQWPQDEMSVRLREVGAA